MQCPLCKKHTLEQTDLAPDLTGLACRDCAGVWIARNNYDSWRARQSGDRQEAATATEFAVTETHKAKLCPQCGHLMLPYRVGHGLAFAIDYCGACGGVWFERNEWEAIKAKNLHDNLHDIVSTHWQTAVRQTAVQEVIEQAYKRLLGASYDKAAEMRAWLRGQPQKGLILAYLADAKPDRK